MGMDITGRNPSSEQGEYFRANVWSWRPIHALIFKLCSDLFTDNELEAMGYNSGAGPGDGAICLEMAKRFENWMEHNVSGAELADPGLGVAHDGRLITEDDADFAEATNPYQVADEHLKEWIGFLRACGGFEVW